MSSEPSGPIPVVVARPVSRAAAGRDPWQMTEITPRQAAWDVALVIFAGIVAHYAPGLLAAGHAESTTFQLDPQFVLIKWCEAALVLGLATYLIFRNGVRPGSLGIRADRPELQLGWSLGGLFLAYVYLLGTGYLVLLIDRFLKSPVVDFSKRVEFAAAMPVDDLLATILLLTAVALHEELLFRGLILTLLRRAVGAWWPAVLISSAIFGALHFQQGALGMLQAGGLSVVFCLVFIWSRSLPALIVTHFLFDFIQFQMIRVMLPWLMKEYPDLFH